jgi:hypothetical protein
MIAPLRGVIGDEEGVGRLSATPRLRDCRYSLTCGRASERAVLLQISKSYTSRSTKGRDTATGNEAVATVGG